MRVGRTSIGSRIVSMLLVICMVFGMVPFSAFAAESATPGNVEKIRDYAAGLLADSFADAGTNNDLSWTTETDKGDNWRYYTGVMLDALLMLGVDSDTNDSVSTNSALEFAQIYMDFNISDSGAVNEWHEGELDSVPPALTLLTILDTAGVDEAHREDYEKAIHFVYNELEDQTSYPNCGGNYLHKQDSNGDPTSSWDKYEIGLDGIYMAQPFLMAYANALAAGKITNANADAATIYKQVYDRLMWVADKMYDSDTGLYHHGYDVTNSKGNGHFWGRGIGWYAAGLVMCIDMMPEGQYKTDLIGKLPKLFDGMINYQDDSGLWYNVVNRDATLTDHNKNKLETSVTALMSYAMMKAYNEGWVKDSKYATAAEKAFNGIVSEKLKSGKITDTYKSSGVCDDDASYCKNSYVSDEAKGVGGVIMAAAEVDKYLGNAETFKAGVVVAPDITTAVGVAPDYSGVKITLVGSQGTIKNVTSADSKVSFVEASTLAVGDAAGKVEVAVVYDDSVIDTFTVNVVDPSVPAEDEGSLTIESTNPNVDTSAPSFTTGNFVLVKEATEGGSGNGSEYTVTTAPTEGKNYLIAQSGNKYTLNWTGSGWAAGEISGYNSATNGVYTISGTICHWQWDDDGYFYTVVGDSTYYIYYTGTSSSDVSATTDVSEATVFTVTKSTDTVVHVSGVVDGKTRYLQVASKAAQHNSGVKDITLFQQASGEPTPAVYAQLSGTEGYAYPFGTASADAIAKIKEDDAFKVLVSANADGSDATELALSDSRITITKNSDYKDNEAKVNNFSVKLDGVEIGTIPVKIYTNTVTNNYDVKLTVTPSALVLTPNNYGGNLAIVTKMTDSDNIDVPHEHSYTMVSDNESVITVGEWGAYTIKGVGTANITVTLNSVKPYATGVTSSVSGISVTIPVTVNADPVIPEVTYSITGLTILPNTIEAGQGANATATAVASDNSTGHSYTFTYAVSGNGVSINSTTGAITTTSEASGTYTVTATLAQVDGNGSFKPGTIYKTAQFTVVEPASYEYTILGSNGNALAGQNITLNEGQTYTPSFSVKLGDQDVTSGYNLTLTSESTAISINGTTITANKVTEDAVATVTATVAPFSRASASGTSVEFTVTVKATAQEPDDGSDASASGNIKDYTGNPPFTPGGFVEVKAPSTSTTSGSSTNHTAATSNTGWQQTVVGTSGSGSTYTHNFTTNGTTSSFYTFVGDNTSTSQGTATGPNDENLTTGFKITSGKSGISFTTDTSGTLTIIAKSGSNDGSPLTVDSTEYILSKNKAETTITCTLDAGDHTISATGTSQTQKDAYVFYISFAENGGSSGTSTEAEYAKLFGSATYSLDTATNTYTLGTLLDQIQKDYKIHTSTTNSGDGTAIAWDDTYCQWEDGADLSVAGEYDLTITYKNQVLGTITVAVNTTTEGTTTTVPGVYAKLDGTEGLSYSLHNASGTIIEGLKASKSLKVLVADNANGTDATELSMSDSKVLVVKQSNYANTLAGTYYFDVFYDEDGDETADSAEKIGSIPVYVNGEATLSVAPSSTTVAVNGTQNLSPVVTVEGVEIPSGEYTITWSTSNAGVATVTNGVVTGVAGGNATITATLTKVTVTNKTDSNKKDENTLDTPISVQVSVTVSGDDHTHSYTSSVTKQPTCTEAGETTYTCSCGESYTESIPATGHNYVNGTCTVCGEKDPDYQEPTTPPAVGNEYVIADAMVNGKQYLFSNKNNTERAAYWDGDSWATGTISRTEVSGKENTYTIESTTGYTLFTWEATGTNTGYFYSVVNGTKVYMNDDGKLAATSTSDATEFTVDPVAGTVKGDNGKWLKVDSDALNYKTSEETSMLLYTPTTGGSTPVEIVSYQLGVTHLTISESDIDSNGYVSLETMKAAIQAANGSDKDTVTLTWTYSDGTTGSAELVAGAGQNIPLKVATHTNGARYFGVWYTELGYIGEIAVTVEAAGTSGDGDWVHNFTTDDLNNDFYKFNSVDLATLSSSVSYDGLTLTKGGYFGSSGDYVEFTAPADGTFTLVENQGGKKFYFYVDGVKGTTIQTDSDGVYTMDVEAGKTYKFEKNNQTHAVYLEYVPTGEVTAYLTKGELSKDKVNIANGGDVASALEGLTMNVTYSDGDTKTVALSNLTYDISKINTAVAGDHTVEFSYTEGGKTVKDTLTVSVAAASSGGGTTTSDLWKHNFSVDGATDEDDFFNIKGNLTDSYDGSYGDLDFDTALKIESSTNIAFTAPNDGTLTLVFNSASAGKDIKINGTSQTIGSDGILIVDVSAGDVTITKDDSVYLFYMEYASAMTDGVELDDAKIMYIGSSSTWPTQTLTYTVLVAGETVTSGFTTSWDVLDDEVLSVDSNGVVTAKKPGTTSVTLTVTMDDGREYKGSVVVRVYGPSVTADEEMSLIAGVDGSDTGKITNTVSAGSRVTDSTKYVLRYESSDNNVATVDANGNVTAVGKGTATITTYLDSVNGFDLVGNNIITSATTTVTVREKEVTDAHLNAYDYVIKAGSTLAELVDLLEYKASVDGAIIEEEGVKLTINYNIGDPIIVEYLDVNSDGTHDGGGLKIQLPTADQLNTVGIYPALVTYTDAAGNELFRDSIWIHVVEYDPNNYDGTVMREDGIHYILDTDGINLSEEYVIVAGNADIALKNPSATAVGSSVAGSIEVELAHGDVYETADGTDGGVFKSDVDYLTMDLTEGEQAVWLLDTAVENVTCPDGVVRLQLNASNLMRYLGGGENQTQLVHTGVKHVYVETVNEAEGEYRIVLGFGENNVPYYLGYEDNIWTATTEDSSVYLYNRVVEFSGDYGFNYELRDKENKAEITELSIPANFVYEFVEPNIFYNNSITALSDGEYTIVWSSSDESVATVNQNGKITAIKASDTPVIITATLYNVYGDEVICNTHNTSHITRTVAVTVTESTPVPVLEPDELTIGVGSMPNFSKINVEMTFEGAPEYNYDVPHDQLTFHLADAVMVDANGNIVYEKDEDGNTTDVPVGFDNTVVGTYEVPVSYAGTEFTLTIYVVEDPYAGLEEADSIPGFPDAGSVRMNKTAEGVVDFTATGVTKIELTAAGVSTKNSVDVVLIVDVSNSMGWSMDWFSEANYNAYVNSYTGDEGKMLDYDAWVASCGDYAKGPATGASGTDKLDMAMSSAKEFANILLNVEGGDNTITFVTFAGADRDHGGESDYVDSVRTPMVGVSDYQTAYNVFDATKFTNVRYLNSSGKDTGSYELQIGGYVDDNGYGEAQVSGSNRGNTNYDYAFGEAIDAVAQVKAKYAAENNGASYDESGRQIHVVFMTDGAPSHYNDKKGTGSAKDTLWDGSGDLYTDLSSNSKDNWLAHIENYNELATQLKDQIYSAYTVGFDMAHGGFGDYSWTEPEMERVLEGLAKNVVIPVTLATNKEELNNFYTSLARALAYAGTNAKVTDKIGGNFSLFTGVSMYSKDIVNAGIMSQETYDAMANYAGGFPITVNSYRLVVYSDIGESLEVINEDGTTETVTVTEAHLGLRVKEDPEVLETITFNAAGTEAYSDVIGNDENGDPINIMSLDKNGNRVIDASTFKYTATLDKVMHDGVETVHAKDETIEWKIGNITDKEVSMQYFAYLDGSLDNPREAVAGVYATNEYAYLEYIDVYGKHATRYYGVPQIAWGAANVTVRFFLVNNQGQYVNRAGVTFTNPANRIFLDGRAHYEAELNNSVAFTALDALAQAGLAGNNILYDVSAGATVTNSTTAGQGGVAWAMNSSLNNIANLLTYVDSSNGFHSNVIIDIPVIMTELGESLRPMADTTVVIDYGKAMDINVFSEAEEAYKGGYPDVRNPDIDGKKYYYKMEIVGFAAYSASHDLRDYVDQRNVTFTNLNDETTYFSTANGKYVVTSANGDTQVRFIPTTILDEVEQVFVAVKFQEYNYDEETGTVGSATDQYYIMYKQLNIIPATIVYYETDGKMGAAYTYSSSGWTLQTGGAAGNAVQDPYTQGSQIYGYDSSYTGDTTWSNGSSWLANGTAAGTDGKFPVNASFTFTGTGFDIISRTGADQGTIRVTYTNKDTGVSQSVSVINKGQLELYQIPVVSVEGLTHGTYTVTIEVYPGITVGSTKVLGSQFYFDAVRIYGTLTGEETIQTGTMNASNEYVTSTFTVDSVYTADSEADPYISEIRDILISAESFSSTGSITGAMYMDDHSGDVDITNYNTYGANNEVYLQKGNAVAFSFTLSEAMSGIDIGMKSVDGTPVTAKVAIMASTATEPTWINIPVDGCTAQFYDLLAKTGYDLASGTVVHVLIQNGSESGTLSLTDLKITRTSGTAAASVVSTQDTLDAAKYMASSQLNVISADFAEDSVRVADTVFMTVVTESKVESLAITNALGEEVWFSAVSAEVDGQLIWTVMLRPTLLNEQTYTVTGFAADGTYGNSASDTITVELY